MNGSQTEDRDAEGLPGREYSEGRGMRERTLGELKVFGGAGMWHVLKNKAGEFK